MKAFMYGIIALSIVANAHTAYAGVACGSSTSVSRNTKTTYKVASILKKPTNKGIQVRKTRATQ